MTKQKQLSPLDKALQEVAQFIEAMSHYGPDEGNFNPAMLLSSAEDGGLQLDSEDARYYRKTLKSLANVATANEKLSLKAVEKLLKKALFSSLDIRERQPGTSLEERLDKALKELKTTIGAKAHTFYVYQEVRGLSSDGLPKKIGQAEFRVFDENHLEQFRSIASQSNPDNRISRMHLVDEIDKALTGKTVAIIEVSANDDDAAKSLAQKELRLTIDTLNFYSDLIPYAHGHVFLPGDTEQAIKRTVTLDDEMSVSLSIAKIGPLTDFSLQKLIDLQQTRNIGFDYVGKILEKKESKLHNRLLAALSLAGRATIDARKEEAFLLYAIALESLILLEGDKEELTYRLRIRIAHLIGDTIEDRRELSSDVNRLYILRSQIVHSGSFQVTDSDLSLMRSIAKNCILRVLIDDTFTAMSSVEDLVLWFNNEILE